MEEVILLSTSLRRGGMKPMEPDFFYPCVCVKHFRCLGSHVWNANASANVSETKWHFFQFLRWSLRLHLRWCSSHVYFPAFAFAFAFASHVWTRLKTKSIIYLTLLSYTPKNSGCLAHQILMTYSKADFPVGSGTLLRKSRVICSWVFIRWRKESTSDCEISREKALGFRNWLVVHDSIVQSNHWSCVMWRASKLRSTLAFAPVVRDL